MADRPILFSGPMVRALLAGTKTQTRRTIKPRGHASLFDGSWADSYVLDPGNKEWRLRDLRIALGDRLYVREHWRCAPIFNDTAPRNIDPGQPRYFEADGVRSTDLLDQDPADGRFRQGMHMPRWASRLTLTVTDVRVERLQDCSNEDALAEGVVPVVHRVGGTTRYSATGDKFGLAQHTPKLAYAHLWDSINGEDAWSENPWVAAYTFTVEHGNIDQVKP